MYKKISNNNNKNNNNFFSFLLLHCTMYNNMEREYREMFPWLNKLSICLSSSSRGGGVIHDAFDLVLHPPLYHCLKTVQGHRAGLPHQLIESAGIAVMPPPRHTPAKNSALATADCGTVIHFYVILFELFVLFAILVENDQHVSFAFFKCLEL